MLTCSNTELEVGYGCSRTEREIEPVQVLARRQDNPKQSGEIFCFMSLFPN